MIYGNLAQQNRLLNLLNSDSQIQCLIGNPFLGKASFLQESLPTLVSEHDLLFVDSGPDGAREAREFACTGPIHGPKKILAILDADSLSDSAQDAYLKLLEEPPAQFQIVLSVANESSLHPAFISRMKNTIRWFPLTNEEMNQFASNIEPLDTELMKMTRGHPGLYSLVHGKEKYKDLYLLVQLLTSGKEDCFFSPVPEAIKDIDGPQDKLIASHICRFAAITSNGRRELIQPVLDFCSILYTPVTPSMHWMNMINAITLSL